MGIIRGRGRTNFGSVGQGFWLDYPTEWKRFSEKLKYMFFSVGRYGTDSGESDYEAARKVGCYVFFRVHCEFCTYRVNRF